MNYKTVLLDIGSVMVCYGIMLFSAVMVASAIANTLEDLELLRYN
jgi:hypothetical protein